ncbi:unnamed protein product [Blepharisma stoltei]|uniref:Uncharacterized protein n=1 Tax=Blepharisma stoltei TaxID=1481888 RepID=A0AAU9IN80_9CILI|nr:unnamed protein product [Blepharisma stoltei]
MIIVVRLPPNIMTCDSGTDLEVSNLKNKMQIKTLSPPPPIPDELDRALTITIKIVPMISKFSIGKSSLCSQDPDLQL